MIHAMTLRARQIEETRAAIVRAAAEILAEGDAPLSIPSVAGRSGVSIRTVYRYFPSKADLVQAIGHVDDPAATAGPLPALDGSDLHEWLKRGWSEEIQTPLLRAQLRTAAGQEVRRSRRARHRAFAEAVIDDWGLDLPSDGRASVADLLLLLTGGAALVELTDVLGAPVERAAVAAAWAVEAVLHHAAVTGGPPDGSGSFVIEKSRWQRKGEGA